MSSVVDEASRPQKPAFGFLARSAARSLVGGLAAAAAWLAVAALTAFWPDRPESDWAYTGDLAVMCGAVAVALALAAFGRTKAADLVAAMPLAGARRRVVHDGTLGRDPEMAQKLSDRRQELGLDPQRSWRDLGRELKRSLELDRGMDR